MVKKLNEVWMVDRMKETNFLSIKRIARFVRIAAAHRERFSLNSISLL